MDKKSKNMIVALDQKVDLLGHASEKVVLVAGLFGKTIAKLPWLLALFVLLIVGLGYTLIAYLPLFFSRLAIEKLVNSIVKNVALLDEREAMIMHADIEHVRKRLDRNAREIKVFFVFKPLFNQIAKATVQYKRLEQALFEVAYPEYHECLTKDQERELLGAFADWRGDEDENEFDTKIP